MKNNTVQTGCLNQPFLTTLTGCLASLMFVFTLSPLAAHAEDGNLVEFAVTGAEGDVLPEGWTSDLQSELDVSTRLSFPEGTKTSATITMAITQNAADCSQQIQSPAVPVEGGKTLSISYVWSGQDLYRDGEESHCRGKVEVYFVSAQGVFIPGKGNYYFEASESKTDTIEILIPLEAAAMRLRIGAARKGIGLGAGAMFTVSDINLSVQP